jgi:ankyrin repeat protein
MKNLLFIIFSLTTISNLHAADQDFTPCQLLAKDIIILNTIDDLTKAIALLDHHTINNPMSDPNQETCLHAACWYGKRDIAKELLLRGANLNAKNCNGRTPLFYAISRKHQPLAQELLLNPDIDVNVQDLTQKTLLHIAASKGYSDIVTTLLQLNVNKKQKDIYGKTPADIARQYGFPEIAHLIDTWKNLPNINKPETE